MKIKAILLVLATAALIPAIAQAKPDGERQGGKRPSPEKMLERLDADSSGSISKEEAPERMQEHFDKIDGNGDGQITAEELKAAAEARRAKRAEKKQDSNSI